MTTVKFFKTEKRPNEVRAQHIWTFMTGYVAFKQNKFGLGKGVITYGHLAMELGYSSTQARISLIEPVKLVSRFCKDNDLPRLTAMIVRQDSKYPGWEDMFPSEEKFFKAQKKVRKYGTGWLQIVPPAANVFKGYKGLEEI